MQYTMHAFYSPTIEPQGILQDREGFHAIRVLRLKVGDTLVLLDGVGTHANAQIISIERDRLVYHVTEQKTVPIGNLPDLTIAVAPPKSADRLEFLVEKLTEIGVGQIALFAGARSERKTVNMEKLHTWAVSALKQSKQFFLPKILWYESLKQFLSADQSTCKLLASLAPTASPWLVSKCHSVSCVIGPEGDFTEEEYTWMRQSGLTEVSLNAATLRTETACLVAAVQIQYSSMLQNSTLLKQP
jgi:16S rRNA (uracil1498-N3)-methyltransferase